MSESFTAAWVLALSREELDRAIGLVSGADEGLPIRRATGRSVYPLSVQQEMYWAAERWRGGTTFFNLALPLRLDGPLDLPLFEHAVTEAVRRHEVLRTTFDVREGRPAQIVHPPWPWRVEPFDEAAVRGGFDLASGPPFRIALRRVSDLRHELWIVAHHILLDSFAMRTLLADIARAYAEGLRGGPARLPDLDIQYGDYASWQRDALAAGRFEPHLAFWLDCLSPPLPRPPLDAVAPMPRVQTFRTRAVPFEIPRSSVSALQAAMDDRPLTPFMVLLAGLHVALCSYDRQRELIVAAAVANRIPAQVEPLLGLFSNIVLIRTPAAFERPVADHVDGVRRACLQALEHQQVPFVELARRFAARGVNLSEWLQILFLFQGKAPQPAELGGLSIRGADAPEEDGRSNFALQFEFVDHGDLTGVVYFRQDWLTPETVDNLLRRTAAVLADMAARPDGPVRAILEAVACAPPKDVE